MPIRRIHDERGPPRSHDVRSEVPPEFVVCTVEIGPSVRSLPALAVRVPAIAILSLGRLFFECGRFLLGEEFLPSKLTRSFQRSNGRVGPHPPQVRLAVSGARRSPFFPPASVLAAGRAWQPGSAEATSNAHATAPMSRACITSIPSARLFRRRRPSPGLQPGRSEERNSPRGRRTRRAVPPSRRATPGSSSTERPPSTAA